MIMRSFIVFACKRSLQFSDVSVFSHLSRRDVAVKFLPRPPTAVPQRRRLGGFVARIFAVVGTLPAQGAVACELLTLPTETSVVH
jgi:hypothetical protein